MHLKNHVKAIHEKIRDKECDKCEYKSSYSHELLKHKRKTHTNTSDECKEGEQVNENSLDLQRHRKEPSYKCNNCDFTSARKCTLSKHKLMCSKGLDSKVKRNTKSNLHQGSTVPPDGNEVKAAKYGCHHCGHKTMKMKDLLDHISTCHDEPVDE